MMSVLFVGIFRPLRSLIPIKYSKIKGKSIGGAAEGKEGYGGRNKDTEGSKKTLKKD
jgi:hypothetical protein